MKFLFHNDTTFNNISIYASDTRMCLERGEGEEEIANHGWSRVKVFSQETEATGQLTPMIGEYEPKLHSKSQVQDAQDSPNRLPFFSSSRIRKLLWTRAAALSLEVAALRTVLAVVGFLLAPWISYFSFLNAIAGFPFRCGTCADTSKESAAALVRKYLVMGRWERSRFACPAGGVLEKFLGRAFL